MLFARAEIKQQLKTPKKTFATPQDRSREPLNRAHRLYVV